MPAAFVAAAAYPLVLDPLIGTPVGGGQFGVAWTEQVGRTSRVMLEAVDASSGIVTHSGTLASSTAGTYTSVDIGCESAAPLGTARVLDAIRAQRLWFGATGTMALAPPVSVFTDTMFGTGYGKPAISRAAASDGKLLVVAWRNTPALGASAIVGAVVTSNAAPLGPTVTIYDDANHDVSVPDVDGSAGEWVVAWQRDPAGASTTPSVLVAKVALAGAALIVGAPTTFGTAFAQISAPTVGHGLAKTWLGYRSVTTFRGPTSSSASPASTATPATRATTRSPSAASTNASSSRRRRRVAPR